MPRSEKILDVILRFPNPNEELLNELINACGSSGGCIENVEYYFDISFSCGDGKFLVDIEDDEKELAKYDGMVCFESLPRFADSKVLFKDKKNYRFVIKRENGYTVYLINNRIRSEY